MNKVLLDILCNPYNHRRLSWTVEDGVDFGETHDWLKDAPGGQCFPIREGIPLFATKHYLSELNHRHQRLHDWVAPVYDRLIEALETTPRMDPPSFYKNLLEDLQPRSGQWILDASARTGTNLEFLPPRIHYVGVDLSFPMLLEARHKLCSLERKADLVQATLTHLPFRENSFDGAMHTEGLRHCDDVCRIIQEMIRVTRPGGFVVIADTTPDTQKGWFECAMDFLQHIAAPRNRVLEEIPGWIPPEMEELRVRTMGEDRYLSIRFRKPFLRPTEIRDLLEERPSVGLHSEAMSDFHACGAASGL